MKKRELAEVGAHGGLAVQSLVDVVKLLTTVLQGQSSQLVVGPSWELVVSWRGLSRILCSREGTRFKIEEA